MPSEVRFYHLQGQGIEDALPLLVSRAHGAGYAQILRFYDAGLMRTIDDVLWTFDPASFLPHAVVAAGDSTQNRDSGVNHPIILTGDPVSQDHVGDNSALIQVGAPEAEDLDPFARAMVMFDGRDMAQVEAARDYWKTLKTSAYALSYWQQDEGGKWEQKA